MFKIFHSHDAHLYIRFYTILPIIDYSPFINALNTVRNTDCLERIVRYFTKRLWCHMHTTTIIPSYPVRHKEFNLKPLEMRLLISDLLLLFRIIRGFVSLSNSEIKFSQLRPYRISLTKVNTTRCKNYFLHRKLLLWNKITRDSSCLTMSLEQ